MVYPTYTENVVLFWNAAVQMRGVEFIIAVPMVSFNIKYMDMSYNAERFECWNQVIKDTSSRN